MDEARKEAQQREEDVDCQWCTNVILHDQHAEGWYDEGAYACDQLKVKQEGSR